MKQFSKPIVLSSLCAGAGLLCLFLRQWLLGAALDSKGLLTPHPAGLLCWLPTIAVAVALVLCWLCKGHYATIATPISTVGTVCGGLGLAAVAIGTARNIYGSVEFILCVLAAVGAVCAAVEAWLSIKSKPVSSLLHLSRILFCIVFLLLRYRQWSGETEFQQYFFQTMAAVGMMFTVYHKALLSVKKGSSLRYLLMSRCSLFFCIAAIPGSSDGFLCGAMALSILFDGSTLRSEAVQEA